MIQVPSLVVLLGLTLYFFSSYKAIAQQFSDSGVVYESARNKIGLIRYCSRHELLSPEVAEQAVSAVEAGLSKLPWSDTFARELGDRAQQAGEDGFWDAGRKRDIASIARLFRTTPADLCHAWADETLRALAPERRKQVTTAGATAPSQVLPQAEPTPAEPIQVYKRPVRIARPAPHPPLPEKAPAQPNAAELTSLQRTLPTSSHLASGNTAGPGQKSGAAEMTQPSEQARPHPSRLASDRPGLPPCE